jgi:hypothetical protein
MLMEKEYGFYRPSLNGIDINRVWKNPQPDKHPEAFQITKVVEKIVSARKFLFF